MNRESLWPRLAELPLVIEACEYERLHATLAYEIDRVTTHVRLVGAGTDGSAKTSRSTSRTAPRCTRRRSRCRSRASGRLPTSAITSRRSTRGRSRRRGTEPLRRRLARSPDVRFKLDAEATWGPALVEEVAATSAVDTIDFKGHYGFGVQDPEALTALYDHVLAAFPDAYLEDPHDLPQIAQRLGDHLERISYDAPIRSAEDIGATPLAARAVNVKPSRIGDLRRLLDVYARCAREQRPMYGGGMGELGVGRGQIEVLAALFHADAPNDVAPSAYNEDHPPGQLPTSPPAGYPESVAYMLTAVTTNVVPAALWHRLPRPVDPREIGAHHHLGRRLATPHLPQGAPTSPALANLAAFRLDRRLDGLARSLEINYSRYADDLTFSGPARLVRAAATLRRAVARIAREEGFTVNEAKSMLATRAGRQHVCGVVVNDHLNTPRREYDILKAILHNTSVHGPQTQNRHAIPNFRAHLLGRIGWVESLNSQRGEKLRGQFAKITWPEP
jgi:hypothetical protein